MPMIGRLHIPVACIAAVFVLVADAQQGPPTITTIQDVRIGMTRWTVVSGLSKQYIIHELGANEPDILVFGKDPNKFEQAEIRFVQGKVGLITVTLYPAMKGEAVRFAEHLFFLLRDRAKVDPATQKVLKANPSESVVELLANHQHLELPVDLYYTRSDRREKMVIEFAAGKDHFEIEISKLEGFPDSVEIQQYSDLFSEALKMK